MNPTIILATLNEESRLPYALDSLYKQTNRPRIVVADSKSTDKTVQIARDWGVEVLTCPRGKLNAIDYAIRQLRPGVAVLCDADKTYPSIWFDAITQPFHDNRVVMTTGICDSSEQGFFDPYFWLAPTVEGTRAAMGITWGGNSAMRSDAYIRAGGYDLSVNQRDFGQTWVEEEVMMARRLRRLGTVEIVPKAKCYNSGRRFFPTTDFLVRKATGMTF